MTDPSPGSEYKIIQEGTGDNPLEVGEYAAVPTSLAEGGEEAALFRAEQCVRDGPWTAALLADLTESTDSWHIHVWYTNTLLSWEDQRKETTVTTIPLGTQFASPPLLAIRHAPGSSTSRSTSRNASAVAFVYVLHAEKGLLYGHKVTANSLTTATTQSSRRPMVTSLSFDEDDRAVVLVSADGTGNHHVLYAATKQGRIFRVQPRPATHSLLPQDITADIKEQQGMSRSLFRLFSTSNETPHRDIEDLVPAPQGSFWTLTPDALQFWRAMDGGRSATSSSSPLKTTYTLAGRLPANHAALPTNFTIVRLAQAQPNIIHVVGTSPGEEEHSLQWHAVSWQYQGDVDQWDVVSLTWLNRLSESEICLAWEATQNGVVWGAFLSDKGDQRSLQRNFFVAVVPENDALGGGSILPSARAHEYDGPLGDLMVSGSFQGDYTTHGVTFASQSGNWVRIQCLAENPANQPQTLSISRSDQRRIEASLFQHLKSTFQLYERAMESNRASFVELPPSWKTPEAGAVRDEVVARLGLEHLPKDANRGDMSKHIAFIHFLEDVGLFRSLMALTKCRLMSFGEEIAASTKLPLDKIEQRAWPKQGLAQWMELYQSKLVLTNPTPEKIHAWTNVLATSLEAARVYQEEHKSIHDTLWKVPKVQKREDVPSWLSHPALQRTFWNFVEFQTQQAENARFVLTQDMEEILHACLDSFRLSFRMLWDSTEIRPEYTNMQKQVISLFCKVEEKVAVAWDLSIKHHYFAGLCELSTRYEKEPDSPYQLRSLVGELASEKDVETNMKFGSFVLKWYVDHNMIGHALEYGKAFPDELAGMMESLPVLQPFRWIVGVRNENYDIAADSLIRNVEKGTTLSDTKISMGLARMANSLANQQSPRDKSIEKFCERANVQEGLLGGTEEALSKPLQAADELLDLAILQLDKQVTNEQKVQTCVHALAVCTTFGTKQEALKGAGRVWIAALKEDYRYFKDFVFSSTTIDVSAVCSSTVLGELFVEASQIPEWTDVHLAGAVVDEVDASIIAQDKSGFRALLQALNSN